MRKLFLAAIFLLGICLSVNAGIKFGSSGGGMLNDNRYVNVTGDTMTGSLEVEKDTYFQDGYTHVCFLNFGTAEAGTGSEPQIYSAGAGLPYGINLYLDTTPANSFLAIRTTDFDDYIKFTASSDVPEITTVGNCNLKLSTSGNADLNFLPNGTGITIVGDATIEGTHSLNANDDLIVGGKLEVDGVAYLDSDLTMTGTLTMETGKFKSNVADSLTIEAFEFRSNNVISSQDAYVLGIYNGSTTTEATAGFFEGDVLGLGANLRGLRIPSYSGSPNFLIANGDVGAGAVTYIGDPINANYIMFKQGNSLTINAENATLEVQSGNPLLFSCRTLEATKGGNFDIITRNNGNIRFLPDGTGEIILEADLTTIKSLLRISPEATCPIASGTLEGTVWYDDTANKLKVFTTSWEALH